MHICTIIFNLTANFEAKPKRTMKPYSQLRPAVFLSIILYVFLCVFVVSLVVFLLRSIISIQSFEYTQRRLAFGVNQAVLICSIEFRFAVKRWPISQRRTIDNYCSRWIYGLKSIFWHIPCNNFLRWSVEIDAMRVSQCSLLQILFCVCSERKIAAINENESELC